MKTQSNPSLNTDYGLTPEEKHEIDLLNSNLYDVLQSEADQASLENVLREYVKLKLQVVNRGLRFGIANNRIFVGKEKILVPFLLGNLLISYLVTSETSEQINIIKVRDGTIITDKLIIDQVSFDGDFVDLESDLYELNVKHCKTARIGHIRDMSTLLERIALTSNIADATFLLRSLVAQTSLLSFKEYLSAKNLQIEVRRLYEQLLNFLNSPISYRMPFLDRILVRNISSLVAKPKLIDRLWNDTIDLAEIYLRGSQIVNEIRRSTHHAIGKRTIKIVKSYLIFLETGNTQELKQLGFSEPGVTDFEARDKDEPKKIVNRILNDLQELLISNDVVSRIHDWQNRYTSALSRCESGESIVDEVELAIKEGIYDENKWMFYHHLRIIRKRVTQFNRLSNAKTAEQSLNKLLDTDPDQPDFNPVNIEENFRKDIENFLIEIKSKYQNPIFYQLKKLIDDFKNKAYFDSFLENCSLRKHLRTGLLEAAFPEQRLLSYELDCLLEEISFLATRHIASYLEENKIDLPECLEIISLCALNLTQDGLHSRQILDLVGMLENKRYTHAELINIQQQIRRNYQHIIRQLIVPFERMGSRLKVDQKELNKTLANIQRFLHDLNTMASFADIALTYIKQVLFVNGKKVRDQNAKEDICEDIDSIIHLSHKDLIRKFVLENDPNKNMRALYGGKGSGLIYISHLNIPTPDGFIFPTTMVKNYDRLENLSDLDTITRKHLLILEEDIKSHSGSSRKFGDIDHPLLLAVRGGSVFSMPGILSTVLFVGMNDNIAESLAHSDPWHAYDSYRRFLDSFGQAVWDLDIEKYGLVEKAKTKYNVKFKEELPWESMRDVVSATKEVFSEYELGDDLDRALNDLYLQLSLAIRAVIASWHHPTSKNYRKLKGICDSWHTAVIVQEMSSGNRRNKRIDLNMDESKASLTGVIPKSIVNDLGIRKCSGEFKFSACGDDLVRGLTTSNSFFLFDKLKDYMPMLDRRLQHKVSRLRNFMGTDQEIEFTVDRGILSVLQSRASEIGANKESFAFYEPGDADTLGLGIRGSAFRGFVAFDQEDFNDLKKIDLAKRDDVDGILMILENPVPSDIPLILLADGLLAAKGGSTSHAAVAINGIEHKDYFAVMSANHLSINSDQHEAVILDSNHKPISTIHKGDILSIHGETGMIYLGSKQITCNGKQADTS